MSLPLVHQLTYSWAGWPKTGHFPPEPDPSFFEATDAAWRADGLRVISRRWTPERIQISFDVAPTLNPVLVVSRAKGRLDHAFRRHGNPLVFSRRVGFRGLGKNTTDTVLGYLAKQYDRVDLADPRYIDTLRAAAWENPGFDLSDPQPTSHGRYWYDLHMVCVTEERFPMGRRLEHIAIRDAVLAWGQALDEKGAAGTAGFAKPGVRSLSVLHDHLHIAFRGAVGRSPMEMAEDLWTRLNRACGCRMFSDRVYVGSFSEYTLNALG